MNIQELGKRIVLDGTINTVQNFTNPHYRETKDGRKIKERRIYRSDALVRISEKDKLFFEKELNLKYDIDLRGNDEIERSPDLPVPGCTYLHCPIEDNLNKTLPEIYPHENFNIPDKAINGTVEYLFRLDKNGDAT